MAFIVLTGSIICLDLYGDGADSDFKDKTTGAGALGIITVVMFAADIALTIIANR